MHISTRATKVARICRGASDCMAMTTLFAAAVRQKPPERLEEQEPRRSRLPGRRRGECSADDGRGEGRQRDRLASPPALEQPGDPGRYQLAAKAREQAGQPEGVAGGVD